MWPRAEALAQISAWFTPVHAERGNANSPQRTQKRGVHARAADVRLLCRSTFEYVVDEEGKKQENFWAAKTVCASETKREISLCVWFLFFLVDFSGDSHGATGDSFPGADRREAAAPIFG